MSCFKDTLNIIADIVAIITGVLATIFYFQFRWEKRKKRLQLEAFLKDDRAAGNSPSGTRTVVALMARLKLTENEVYQACFGSDHIFATYAVDRDTRRATEVLFGYMDNAPPIR